MDNLPSRNRKIRTQATREFYISELKSVECKKCGMLFQDMRQLTQHAKYNHARPPQTYRVKDNGHS